MPLNMGDIMGFKTFMKVLKLPERKVVHKVFSHFPWF